jgi:hypothetical protein
MADTFRPREGQKCWEIKIPFTGEHLKVYIKSVHLKSGDEIKSSTRYYCFSESSFKCEKTIVESGGSMIDYSSRWKSPELYESKEAACHKLQQTMTEIYGLHGKLYKGNPDSCGCHLVHGNMIYSTDVDFVELDK